MVLNAVKNREGMGRRLDDRGPGAQNRPKVLLAIGGHDLSNGAGITKDLEIFSVLGCYGISVPTSLVVQGPGGVRGVTPVPERAFGDMLALAGEDFSLSGIKIGVLADRAHVERVAEFIGARRGVPVVLDPVMAAKNDTKLVTDEGIEAMRSLLFPLVTCLTPNIDEAQLLLDEEIGTAEDMEGAAQRLAAMGPGSVVLKGGHLSGEPVDLLFDGRESVAYKKQRIGKVVHGTGCMFSSSLCAFLAIGYPVREAFMETERVMEGVIGGSSQPAEGGYFYGCPGMEAGRLAAKSGVIEALSNAGAVIGRLDIAGLLPVHGMTLCYATIDARTPDDVASLSILRDGTGGVRAQGEPAFGQTTPVTELCLACMSHYPFLRSAAIGRCDPAMAGKARETGLSVVSGEVVEFDRGGTPPDMVYKTEGAGHDGTIAIIARTPAELIKKMEMIKPCTTN